MKETRVLPDGGELVYDWARVVPVGDRGIPETVLYRHSGNSNQPAYEIRLEVWDGVPVIAEVKVTAKREQGVHIRAKDIKLAAVDLDSSIAYWLSEVAYQPEPTRPGRRRWKKGYPVSAAERRDATRAVERARRETRRKMTNEHLRRVAETYKAASPAKHEAVARAFDVSPRTAQRYIEKARDAGLLPKSGDTE
jgi:hypothetical protein